MPCASCKKMHCNEPLTIDSSDMLQSCSHVIFLFFVIILLKWDIRWTVISNIIRSVSASVLHQSYSCGWRPYNDVKEMGVGLSPSEAPLVLVFWLCTSHLHVHTHSGSRDGIHWFSKSKASLLSVQWMLLEGRKGCRGTMRVGVGRAGGSVGGRAARAGAADYSGNCQLQCLQSGSNRFRVGEEEVTVDFCQASLCLCVSRLSGMTFARRRWKCPPTSSSP